MTNLSTGETKIETRHRIAQSLFLKPEEIKFVEVEEIDKTERGDNGFGSTGKYIKKNMYKIVVEEFDVCHKFVENCVEYILPPNEREFVNISHLVGSKEFHIFVGYNMKNLEVELNNLLMI